MKLYKCKKYIDEDSRQYIKKYYICGCKIITIKSKVWISEFDFFKLMNQVVDIRNCPKAKGKLRKLQIADTFLLAIFHNICKRYNIKYCLEGGEFIGRC